MRIIVLLYLLGVLLLQSCSKKEVIVPDYRQEKHCVSKNSGADMNDSVKQMGFGKAELYVRKFEDGIKVITQQMTLQQAQESSLGCVGEFFFPKNPKQDITVYNFHHGDFIRKTNSSPWHEVRFGISDEEMPMSMDGEKFIKYFNLKQISIKKVDDMTYQEITEQISADPYNEYSEQQIKDFVKDKGRGTYALYLFSSQYMGNNLQFRATVSEKYFNKDEKFPSNFDNLEITNLNLIVR